MSFISKLLLLSFFNLVRGRENVTYTYTLWIGHQIHITAYTMQLTSPAGITFFEAMMQAKESGNTYYDFDSGSAPYFATSISKISGIDSSWYVRCKMCKIKALRSTRQSLLAGIRDGSSTKWQRSLAFARCQTIPTSFKLESTNCSSATAIITCGGSGLTTFEL